MREIDKRLSEKIAVGSFIATLLVVLIHTPHNFDTVDWPAPFEYLIVEGFARIAVPYFFVVSGYFLCRGISSGGWGVFCSEVRKRMFSLLFPYFLWCGIYVFARLMFDGLINLHNGLPFMHGYVRPSTVRVFGLLPWVDPMSVQLWYLRCLFSLVIVAPVFVFLLNRGLRICVLFLAGVFVGNCILPGILPKGPLHTIFRHAFVFNGIFYFFAGMVLYRYGGSLSYLRFSKGKLFAMFIVTLALYGVSCYLRFYPSSISADNVRLVIISAASTVGNLLLLVVSWCRLPDWTLPSFLRGLSFPVYLVHYIFVYGMRFVCIDSACKYLMVAACIFMLSWLCTVIIRANGTVAKILYGGR